MESIAFNSSKPITLGVEIEVQLLDRETFELVSVSPAVLAKIGVNDPQIKAEIMQNMLEINTVICNDAHEVRDSLLGKIDVVERVAHEMGVRLAMSGTHPFGKYSETDMFPMDRYKELIDRNQWIARRLMIFGLHVHVGMRSGDHCIQMNNALLHYLPMLLALSASSPFWQGVDTGLASCRVTAFEIIPTGGTPCVVNSWSEFQKLISLMVRSGAITALKDLWWDVRPSPKFGTLEIRICDGLPSLDEVVSIVSLIHCLCAWLDDQLQKGQLLPPPQNWILRENKWRASRHGKEMKIVINDAGDTKDFNIFFSQLLSDLKPYIERFRYEKEIELIVESLIRGQSYQRQREVAKGPDGLKLVAASLAEEFSLRHPKWAPL
jgi:glutamate---cysteine ligase / carboxylate-amine ligase